MTKAKAVKPFAEQMITLGRRGDLHARRQAMAHLRSQEVVHKLFAEVAPRFAGRPGGYSRIVRIGPRPGDAAEMAFLELVDFSAEEQAEEKAARRRLRLRRREEAELAAEAETAEEQEVPAEEPARSSAVGQASACPRSVTQSPVSVALSITTRFVGCSVARSPSSPIFCTTGIPAVTRPSTA